MLTNNALLVVLVVLLFFEESRAVSKEQKEKTWRKSNKVLVWFIITCFEYNYN